MLGIEIPSVGSGAYSEDDDVVGADSGCESEGRRTGFYGGSIVRHGGKTALDSQSADDESGGHCRNRPWRILNRRFARTRARRSPMRSTMKSSTATAARRVWTGLIHQQTDPSNPGALVLFDTFLKSFSDQVDGLWASRMKDMSIVANVEAYKLAATTFRGTAANGGPALTFADYAATVTGGFSTNARMPRRPTRTSHAASSTGKAGRGSGRRVCLSGARSRWTTSTRTRPAGNGISR